MIKIILKIDDDSFRQHAEEQEESNPETIKKYIMEEVMEALGSFCLEDLPKIMMEGLAQEKNVEYIFDIRDEYQDIVLPIGED